MASNVASGSIHNCRANCNISGCFNTEIWGHYFDGSQDSPFPLSGSMDLASCAALCGPSCPNFDHSMDKCYLRTALNAANLQIYTLSPTATFPKSANCSVPYTCYTATVDSYPNGALLYAFAGLSLPTCADRCNADAACAGFTFGASGGGCRLCSSNAGPATAGSGFDHFYKTNCVPTSSAPLSSTSTTMMRTTTETTAPTMTTLALHATTEQIGACYNHVYNSGYFNFGGSSTYETSLEDCVAVCTAAGGDNLVYNRADGMCFVGPPLSGLGGFLTYATWLHIFRTTCDFNKICFEDYLGQAMGGAGFPGGTFSDPWECGEACEANPPCVAFVFSSGSGVCELKTALGAFAGDATKQTYVRVACDGETTLSPPMPMGLGTTAGEAGEGTEDVSTEPTTEVSEGATEEELEETTIGGLTSNYVTTTMIDATTIGTTTLGTTMIEATEPTTVSEGGTAEELEETTVGGTTSKYDTSPEPVSTVRHTSQPQLLTTSIGIGSSSSIILSTQDLAPTTTAAEETPSIITTSASTDATERLTTPSMVMPTSIIPSTSIIGETSTAAPVCYGLVFLGGQLSFSGPVLAGTPKWACRAACDADPACEHFVHSAADDCWLGRARTGLGNAVLASDRNHYVRTDCAETRTCFATYTGRFVSGGGAPLTTGQSSLQCSEYCAGDGTCVSATYKHTEDKCWVLGHDSMGDSSDFESFVKADCESIDDCVSVLYGMDIDSGEIASTSGPLSAQGCVALCESTVGCIAAVHEPRKGQCWAMSVDDDTSADASYDSYILAGCQKTSSTTTIRTSSPRINDLRSSTTSPPIRTTTIVSTPPSSSINMTTGASSSTTSADDPATTEEAPASTVTLGGPCYGLTIIGGKLDFPTSPISGTPLAGCRALCDASPACQHFAHVADADECRLGGSASDVGYLNTNLYMRHYFKGDCADAPVCVTAHYGEESINGSLGSVLGTATIPDCVQFCLSTPACVVAVRHYVSGDCVAGSNSGLQPRGSQDSFVMVDCENDTLTTSDTTLDTTRHSFSTSFRTTQHSQTLSEEASSQTGTSTVIETAETQTLMSSIDTTTIPTTSHKSNTYPPITQTPVSVPVLHFLTSSIPPNPVSSIAPTFQSFSSAYVTSTVDMSTPAKYTTNILSSFSDHSTSTMIKTSSSIASSAKSSTILKRGTTVAIQSTGQPLISSTSQGTLPNSPTILPTSISIGESTIIEQTTEIIDTTKTLSRTQMPPTSSPAPSSVETSSKLQFTEHTTHNPISTSPNTILTTERKTELMTTTDNMTSSANPASTSTLTSRATSHTPSRSTTPTTRFTSRASTITSISTSTTVTSASTLTTSTPKPSTAPASTSTTSTPTTSPPTASTSTTSTSDVPKSTTYTSTSTSVTCTSTTLTPSTSTPTTYTSTTSTSTSDVPTSPSPTYTSTSVTSTTLTPTTLTSTTPTSTNYTSITSSSNVSTSTTSEPITLKSAPTAASTSMASITASSRPITSISTTISKYTSPSSTSTDSTTTRSTITTSTRTISTPTSLTSTSTTLPSTTSTTTTSTSMSSTSTTSTYISSNQTTTTSAVSTSTTTTSTSSTTNTSTTTSTTITKSSSDMSTTKQHTTPQKPIQSTPTSSDVDSTSYTTSGVRKTTTTEAWKVAGLAAAELERLAGVPPGSIPADVLAAVEEGNPGAFVDWLDSSGLRTSKAQYRRLKASGELYNFPRALSDAIDAWFNASWLQGAVRELDKFSGNEVPEDILDQLEEGEYGPYFAWLNASRAEPPPGRLLRLHSKASGVEMPQAFVEAVDQWFCLGRWLCAKGANMATRYAQFGVVFTSSPPPTTPPTTERTLAPGETTTPPFPLSSEEAVAVSILQSMGCASLIGILATTLLLYGLVVRDNSIERCLHMNQEVSLLLGHTLILLMRDRTDIHVLKGPQFIYFRLVYTKSFPAPCKLVSAALQALFLSNFAFLALEAFQAYTITSSVVGKEGVFNRKQFMAIGWLIPAVYAGGSALFLQSHYASFWSCWLNLGHAAAMATLVPVAVLAGAAIVLVEAGGMEAERAAQPDADEDQATAAMANQKGLLFVVPANLGSWFVGLYAVYEANVALYGLVFGLNLALALAIFTFHTLGNPKVHGMMKKYLPCLG